MGLNLQDGGRPFPLRPRSSAESCRSFYSFSQTRRRDAERYTAIKSPKKVPGRPIAEPSRLSCCILFLGPYLREWWNSTNSCRAPYTSGKWRFLPHLFEDILGNLHSTCWPCQEAWRFSPKFCGSSTWRFRRSFPGLLLAGFTAKSDWRFNVKSPH